MTGDVEQDLKTLSSFVFQQSEELRYLLNNLDVTNFNDLGLMRYENGRLQIYTEELNIKAKELTAEFEAADEQLKTNIAVDINGLRTEVEEEIEGLGTWVSTVEQTAEGLKTTVSGQSTDIGGLKTEVTNIKQTSSQIQTTVTSHTNKLNTHDQNISGLQSQITQNANSISLVVKNGNVSGASIVTAINAMGKGEVQISADRVNISGFVTFTDLSTEGSTTINAGNITTGSISANRISGGTLEGIELVSASESWAEVAIRNGSIFFPNGQLSNSRYWGIALESYTDMFIGTAEDGYKVYFQTGDTFRFTMPNGRYWVLDGSGMNYYTESGAYINGFAFAN